jgi:multiple sugar transport system substrate-binding protein
MKTRRVFCILAALVVIFMLISWLFDHQPRSIPPRLRDVIRFSHFGNADEAEFWRQTIVDFENANRQVRVVSAYPEGMSQHIEQIRQQICSESLPDVLLIPYSAFPEFAEHFEKIQRPEGELEPTGLEAFEIGGQQRGLPFSGGNLLIFLNRKSFEKASEFHGKPVTLPGDDWTVAQFLRTAEALTCDFDRDGHTDQFGFWLPRWIYYLPFIWSFGADLTDQQAARWTFSGPAAQSVMRFYRQLATGDRVAPHEEEVPQLFQDTGFLTGKTAMCVNGPWFIPFLDKTDLAGDYAVVPIPRGPGGRATRITWDGIVIRKNLPPKQRERAERFIAHALSKEVQGRLARMGKALPARMDAQEEFVSADPVRRTPFIDALCYSRLQPLLPRFESIDRAITQHFGDAVDPKHAFDALIMLDALARDPAVANAFADPRPSRP